MMDVMIDLETLGTAPGSAIVAIGAVAFDPASRELGAPATCRITAASCQHFGLTIDADTVEWWLKQSDAARSELLTEPRQHIRQALGDFQEWLVAISPSPVVLGVRR